MIWITSDWHFCHDKEFLYKPRGFDNVADMNAAIVKNHNKVVKDTDDVYCLGDCVLNDLEQGIEYIKQLKGNIHIIKGNHDTDRKIEIYKTCHNVVEICDIKIIKYSKKISFYLSHYPTLTGNLDDMITKKKLINICGHSHTNNKFTDIDKGLIYHVEVDAHNCYPVSIEQILIDLKLKKGS